MKTHRTTAHRQILFKRSRWDDDEEHHIVLTWPPKDIQLHLAVTTRGGSTPIAPRSILSWSGSIPPHFTLRHRHFCREAADSGAGAVSTTFSICPRPAAGLENLPWITKPVAGKQFAGIRRPRGGTGSNFSSHRLPPGLSRCRPHVISRANHRHSHGHDRLSFFLCRSAIPGIKAAPALGFKVFSDTGL